MCEDTFLVMLMTFRRIFIANEKCFIKYKYKICKLPFWPWVASAASVFLSGCRFTSLWKSFKYMLYIQYICNNAADVKTKLTAGNKHRGGRGTTGFCVESVSVLSLWYIVVYWWTSWCCISFLLLSGHFGKSEKWQVSSGEQIHHRQLFCTWEAWWWGPVDRGPVLGLWITSWVPACCVCGFSAVQREISVLWHYPATSFSITRLSLSLSGGRYKKEVLVDGQSYLLLIREEPGSPDAQVLVWMRMSLCEREKESERKTAVSMQIWSTCRLHQVSFLFLSSVQQLGWCSDPGLQSGEWGQFPGALPALQPAQCSAHRHPGHSGRHPRLAKKILWLTTM